MAQRAWERIESIHTAIDIVDPNFGHFDIMYFKGRTLLELGTFEPAIGLLRKVHEHYKVSEVETHLFHDNCYYLARAYNRSEQDKDALLVLNEIDESNLATAYLPDYLVLKCLCFEPLRLNDDLIQTAEQLMLVRIQEYEAVGFYYSAMGHYRRGDTKESVNRLKKAIHLSDEKHWVYEYAKVGLERIDK